MLIGWFIVTWPVAMDILIASSSFCGSLVSVFMRETAGGHHHFTVSFSVMLVTVLRVSVASKVFLMPTL